MNPYQAYQKQRESIGWTRIDLLLSLYDGAIGQLTASLKLLRNNDRNQALTNLSNAQLLLMGLASVAPVDCHQDLGENLLRLYEFCVFRIAQGTKAAVEDAIRILQSLRKGYEDIRPKLVEMERCGKLRSADSLRMIQGVA